MLRDLRNARLRKLLMLGSALATAVLLVPQAVLSKGTFGERLQSIAQSTLSSITALIITSGVAIAFYHVFLREEAELSGIESLDPERSRAEHARAVANSPFWFAEGHIGRWVRENVVPLYCASTGVKYTVLISVLNPDSEDLCQIHAGRRKNQYARMEQRWDVTRVQAEICATVLACAVARAQFDRLRVTIYLKNDSAPNRLDISETAAFITTDDALAPVIRVGRDTRIFSSILDHFQEYGRHQPSARRLNIDAAAVEAGQHLAARTLPIEMYARVASAAGLKFSKLQETEFCKLVQSNSKLLRDNG